MSRRLSIIKLCATCGTRFRPFKVDSKWCSRRCFKIKDAQMHPERYRMEAATKANAERRQREIGAKVAGLTPEQIWTKAYARGWWTASQKFQRLLRKSA